jgi:hypothetical protein
MRQLLDKMGGYESYFKGEWLTTKKYGYGKVKKESGNI